VNAYFIVEMSGSLEMNMFQCVYSFFHKIFHRKSFVIQLPQLSPNFRTYSSEPLNLEDEQTWRNLLGQEKRFDA
jgi:hypothetical protein